MIRGSEEDRRIVYNIPFVGGVLINEIRTPRSMECFGCGNVKCVIRFVDKNPRVAFSHPLELLSEASQVPYWWD